MEKTEYQKFLEQKEKLTQPIGQKVNQEQINQTLHKWQQSIVEWACNVGRAAIFADCGLGKTFMQLEWLRLMHNQGGLIASPLSVARQTVREAKKLGITIEYIRETPADTGGLFITNYEMLDKIDENRFDAVVLDESSILKNYSGKLRTQIIKKFKETTYKLACTATPAPNDTTELINHAEFLGMAKRQDMLGAYFITNMDKNEGGGYRLKGHAKEPMFRWMAGWACAIRKPSDLGYSDESYNLPNLNIIPEIVQADIQPEDQLFATDLGGVGGRAKIRKQTIEARINRVIEIINNHPNDQWILWCGLNDEASILKKMLPESINIEGSWEPDKKAQAFEDFQDGKQKIIITKPSIAGFGMNFQNAHKMIFVGLGDSYESYYQSIRRCYRFGQTKEVDVHIVVSEIEQQIALNVARKEKKSSESADLLIKYQTIQQGESA